MSGLNASSECIPITSSRTREVTGWTDPIKPKYKGISVVINCMLCHGYSPTSFLYAVVIPIPTNTKLNLSSTCNYRAIALSNIFSKILDIIIMSLQSEYLMTSY